jgi:hypothetical protein
LEQVRSDLAHCKSRLNEVDWPDQIEDVWRAEAFQEKISESLREMGVDGDVLLYCEEFPCIAYLPEGTDNNAFEAVLQRAYGEDAFVQVRAHAMVGPWGAKNLRMATAAPAELVDEHIRERIGDRGWDIIRNMRKDFLAEVDGRIK